MLRYFNFKSSLKLWWCWARDLFWSQIPVTAGRFELQISWIQSSYLTHYVIGPNYYFVCNYFICKRLAVQTLLWSLEFVIKINLEPDTTQFKVACVVKKPKKKKTYIYIYICVCVCVYVYTCIYVHMYVLSCVYSTQILENYILLL